ncbi:MAG: amidohydrolase family protein [Leptospira sp.]|nr:amidohydrolase family protein [Leptospira sp.]
MEWEIQNANIVSSKGLDTGNIIIKNGKIESTDKSESASHCPVLSGEDLYVYPALINAHDHLIGSYSPSVLTNSPYLSWLSWDNTLKSSLIFSERQTLDIRELYELGSYKNLFGGTTTVMDHIPHFVANSYRDSMPIRILKDYSLSHSIGTYSLGWGDGPALEYANAVKKNIPYVTHIGEGIDEESKDSLRLLEKLGALGENSVLVHGVPFGKKEIQKIISSKANMVWCPNSNWNLFREIPPIAGFLEAKIPVSLGTDLSLCGSGDLFGEMKAAKKLFQEKFGYTLSSQEIFKMVTENPAKALKLDKILGSIEKGKSADLLILKKNHEDPYENLIQARSEDIVVLSKEGRIVLADHRLEGLVEDLGEKLEKVSLSDQNLKLVVGSPKKLLKSIRIALGYKKDLAFLPIIE